MKKEKSIEDKIKEAREEGAGRATMKTLAIAGMIFTSSLLVLGHYKKKFEPQNIRIEYVNQDTLPDLVYKSGDIYLQTKDGKFVSYDNILEQEKERVDAAFKAKQDSIKNLYMNK